MEIFAIPAALIGLLHLIYSSIHEKNRWLLPEKGTIQFDFAFPGQYIAV